MQAVMLVFGYIHILLALVMTVQYIAFPMYDDPMSNKDLADDVWNVIDYFSAVGAIAAVFFSYLRCREADKTDLREYIASSTMFIASVSLLILFFEQWFAAGLFAADDFELSDFRAAIWSVINVAYPVTWGAIGIYLIKDSRS